jgi:hypothetical protein
MFGDSEVLPVLFMWPVGLSGLGVAIDYRADRADQTDQIDQLNQKNMPGFPYNPKEGDCPTLSVLSITRNRAIVHDACGESGIGKVICIQPVSDER